MNSSKRILIVEDETAIAEPLVYVLAREGYAATHVTLGRDGLTAHATAPFDLVVLDVGLPDASGFDVLRSLRGDAEGSVPVLFLTARGDEIDRVLGLELGADDYVVKPFSPREVAARIKAILRRHGGTAVAAPTQSAAPQLWKLDAEATRIRYHGVPLDLTRYEYRLLALLVAHPGRIHAREDIMARVWHDAPDTADRTIDAHVKTLRAKLRQIDAAGDPIRTHRGLGYSAENA
jgi:two-component system, OmpR family, catabolic regulation response regulator CreB